MPFDSIESVEEFLDEIPKFQSAGSSAVNFDLSRFERFCEYLDNPQRNFPSIHVAGTNGKGSTCRILASVIQQAGYDVGLYTSPHIDRFNERFQINKELIPDKELVSFFAEHSEKLTKVKLTYFEISTAIAFWWFDRRGIDIAIIEVGLGGRLDATNIIMPLVSVITSISLDHTDFLGENIRDIAHEKGGIIKSGRPVVMGDLEGEARDEILQIAGEKESPVYPIDRLNPTYVEPNKYRITVEGNEVVMHSSLKTPVQAKNIAIAWQAVQQISDTFLVSLEQFKRGIARVNIGSGRFERLVDSQHWYFDGGHNVEAVKELKHSIKTIGKLENTTLVLSLMKDKIRRKVMMEFLDFPNIYYYQLNVERAASFDDIVQWLPQVKPFPDDRRKQLLLNDFNSELVIFAGSFYFYVTVRDWVKALDNR